MAIGFACQFGSVHLWFSVQSQLGLAYEGGYGTVIGSFLGAVTWTVLALIPMRMFSDENRSILKWIPVLFPVVVGILVVITLCFVFRVDFVVNGTMYQYGLHFSQEWAGKYWTIVRLLSRISMGQPHF